MRRIHEIEGLRCFVAWWIVLNHLALLTDFKNANLTGPAHYPFLVLLMICNNSGEAVNIFMIISGFVIFYLMDHQKPTYAHFIAGRFFRLFPLYLACVIAAIFLSPLAQSSLTLLVSPANDFAMRLGRIHEWHTHFAVCFAPTVLMLQGLIPNRLIDSIDNIFLAPTWSLTLEWQFYLVAPFLYFGLKKPGKAALPTLAIILFCVAAGSRISWNRSLLVAHISWFFLGLSSFYLFRFLAQRQRPPITANEDVVALGLLILAVIPRSIPLVIWTAVFMITFSREIFARPPWFLVWFRGLLAHPLSRFLGQISYSTYLVHWLIITITIWILLRENPHLDSTRLFFYAALPTVVLTVLASFLTYTWIEKPGMALGKKWTRR